MSDSNESSPKKSQEILGVTKGNPKAQRSNSISVAIQDFLPLWLEESSNGSTIDFELRPGDGGFAVPFDITGCLYFSTIAEVSMAIAAKLPNWLDTSSRRKYQIDIEVIPDDNGFLVPFSVHGNEEWLDSSGWKPDVQLVPGEDKGLESLALVRRIEHATKEIKELLKNFSANNDCSAKKESRDVARIKIRSGVCSWVEVVSAFYESVPEHKRTTPSIASEHLTPLWQRQANALAGVLACLKTLPLNANRTNTKNRLFVVRCKIRFGHLCWSEIAKASYVNLSPDKVRNF